MKDRFLKLQTSYAPDSGFVQDAIECALLHNWVPCSGEAFEADMPAIMPY